MLLVFMLPQLGHAGSPNRATSFGQLKSTENKFSLLTQTVLTVNVKLKGI